MPGTVGHKVDVVSVAPEGLENDPRNLAVTSLALRAHQVRLTDAAPLEDSKNGRRVVVNMNPVANVRAVTEEARPHSIKEIRDLPGNELLNVLARPIVIRANRDG